MDAFSNETNRRQRPQRISLPDFNGRLMTLPEEPVSWQELADNGEDILLLGLGPANPANLPFVASALKNGKSIYWIEDEHTLKATNNNVDRSKNWQRLTMAEVHKKAAHCRIFFYGPGLRLAPRFWGPLLAGLELTLSKQRPSPTSGKSVWLPGNSSQLLHLELTSALYEAGYDQVLTATAKSAKSLIQSWEKEIPEFALSINFRGLDSEGHIFYLLREMRIPLAIWLVDNPFHLLSSIKYPWWQDAHIYLTDPGFIEDLHKLGAANVFFCPLASSQHMWRKCGENEIGGPIFVGRSAFPDQDSFFKGIHIDAHLVMLAEEQFAKGRLPDYHWWLKKLKVKPWPGMAARQAGKGADLCSAYNRGRWLEYAVRKDLKIIGDSGWKKILPQVDISPPVDYYGSLPDLYNQALCVLNITSLLLPQSLNQRHFDVWAAGGLLLTDESAGLSIFPQELVQPIILKKPDDFEERLEFYKKNSAQRTSLIKEWQKCISENHQYRHRLKFIMEKLKI